MPGPTLHFNYDASLEDQSLRKAGTLGSGHNAHRIFAMSYESLPPEAKRTINLIIAGGPFPYPMKDGTSFGNKFGDLPSGDYLEFTVPTPGASNRGARRIVARKTNGMLFFTACHYERYGVTGGSAVERTTARANATDALDEELRNGFYCITGMTADFRKQIRDALQAYTT